MKRIAITGMGSINALGAGVAAFVDGLRAGRCGIGALSLFDSAGFRSSRAAEVKELPAPAFAPRAIKRRASRTTMLALIAAHEAWRMAGIEAAVAAQAGVVLGTTTGGMATGEEAFRRTLCSAKPSPRLSEWLETPVSAPVDTLAHAFECGGPRLTVSTACSSSANALGIAADWIRGGRADTVLCGGTDSLCRMTYSGFNVLQALDREPCRPFDKDRAGLTLGEGAAVFVFEAWESAWQRGARILGEFVSYGVSADAHHLTQPRPDGEGAMMAMRRALAEGDVAAEAIDYVNAHGTGTPLNDVVETRAIKAVLGGRAYRVPVSSTKSMIGHCLGAAGAIEALACLLALQFRFIPPTVNLTHPDPECDLDYVPSRSRAAELRTVLSNSYGFGGNNTSLILRGYDG
ncbi:MAG: beta-ketoacyl-[acyl-carrier-protein] synthase family protein [Deltaproteobacteria bacterium]|nr:beta-ketoacyl-[acyl-carrier-protein] synthase family protein [Deltaproteobacteria bacterium]MBI3386618.1 beta-ketoacyl-[acyl-carrier-protein] synthase family protein [Deltaproteobacteria bacterium]